jgi:ATP-dependent exoDNAse (exonuclease V) alpha subunit
VGFLAGLRTGEVKVANGAQGEIIGIDQARRAATVRLDAGDHILVPVPVEAPTVPLRLAYAGHVAKTQGAEAPVVLVVPGYAHSSLESAYSALTRGSEQIHVYLDHTTHGHDPLATLAQRWQAPDPKRSATAQARRYASWVTRPPGWQATHPDPDQARLRLGAGPEAGWTPPPMTRARPTT